MRIITQATTVFAGYKRIGRFSTTQIPQLKYADQLSSASNFSEAARNYQRVLQILEPSKESLSREFHNVNAKLIGCHFLTRKYSALVQLITDNYIKASGLAVYEKGYDNYLMFSYACAHCHMKLPIQPIDHPNFKDIANICTQLLGVSEDTLQPNSSLNSFDVLARISANLNSRADYRCALVSLIDRDNKKLRKNEAGEEVSLFMCPHPQSELLYHMGLILNQQHQTVAEKTFTNQRINEILKSYENNRSKEVYKPLIGLLMSLITERHYMAAEGMLGHIKSGQSGLFCSGGQGVLKDSQDHNLVENIYRMLVTRANHQSFEEGWSRETPVNLGLLVAQRLIAAPLHGHTVTNLI